MPPSGRREQSPPWGESYSGMRRMTTLDFARTIASEAYLRKGNARLLGSVSFTRFPNSSGFYLGIGEVF